MTKRVPFKNLNALAALRRIARGLALGFTFILLATTGFSQAQLIKDLNRGENPFFIEYGEFAEGNGVLFFVNLKKELWKSDGTASGTTRIKALKSISKLTMVNSTLYFVGDDGTGPELWRSNGTTAVTTKVRDIRPGTAGSNPHSLTGMNGILYFVANDGRKGDELWRSNGTQAGTTLVKDIFVGGGSGKPSHLVNVNGTLYFSAYNNTYGAEFWKSDGTTVGTVLVKDINPGANGSLPASIVSLNGTAV